MNNPKQGRDMSLSQNARSYVVWFRNESPETRVYQTLPELRSTFECLKHLLRDLGHPTVRHLLYLSQRHPKIDQDGSH